MSRRIVFFVLSFALCGMLAAQEQAFGFYDAAIGVSVSPQAGAVINGGPVTFAYGGGLRGSAQINPIARLQGAVEYLIRDEAFDLTTLDFTVLMDFGHPFFLGLGLYFAPILNGVPNLGWDYFAAAEFGWAAEIGYRFPGSHRPTLGFDVHMALTDLFPKEYNSNTGRVNQLDIRWGFWLGLDLWRGGR